MQGLEREGLVIVRPRRGRLVRSAQRLRWHLSEFERPDHMILTTSPARQIASIPLSSALMTSGGGGSSASGDRCSHTSGPTIGGCSSSARSTTSCRVIRSIDDKNANWSS
ncbi:hypothetical protein, partial [Trebonia sp.]|uniref:hypothetical protein n=1 Tax=Trebonia sp. TaxID=2767075 RepID=UPI00345BAC03